MYMCTCRVGFSLIDGGGFLSLNLLSNSLNAFMVHSTAQTTDYLSEQEPIMTLMEKEDHCHDQNKTICMGYSCTHIPDV